MRCVILLGIVLSLIWTAEVSASAGHISVLSGPARGAYSVERGGRIISTDAVQMEVEEGDIVTPGPKATLVFAPKDVACDEVELIGQFTVTACPKPEKGLIQVIYDNVEKQIRAPTSMELQVVTASLTTFKGDDPRLYAIWPEPFRVFIQNEDQAAREARAALIEVIGRIPNIALVDDQGSAEMTITVDPSRLIKLNSGGQSFQFQLPGEAQALRSHISAQRNRALIGRPAGKLPDGVRWSARIHTPALGDEGNGRSLIKAGNLYWVQRESIPLERKNEAVTIPEPNMVTFEIINDSPTRLYAYLINYTDDGQVLPFLTNEPTFSANLLPAGSRLDLSAQKIQLTSSREYVRLILSENLLDLEPLAQDSFTSMPISTNCCSRLRPTPPGTWFSSEAVFELKADGK